MDETYKCMKNLEISQYSFIVFFLIKCAFDVRKMQTDKLFEFDSENIYKSFGIPGNSKYDSFVSVFVDRVMRLYYCNVPILDKGSQILYLNLYFLSMLPISLLTNICGQLR